MDCPGEYLKRERELRDVSLDDISREIRVPIKLLRALEEDDYQSLPHTTFVKGFIRAYCKFLGVDENDALLRYELYLQEIAEFEEPDKRPKSLDVEERSYPVRKSLRLVLVAAGIIIIAGFYFLSSNSYDVEQAGKTIGEVSITEDVAKEVVKAEDKELLERKVTQPGVRRKEQLVEKTPEAVEPKAPRAVKPALVIDETPGVVEEVAEEKNDETPFVSLPALGERELALLDLAPGEHVLRAHASALTWMKVTIGGGDPFEIMLQPGESVQWKGTVFFCS